MSFLKRKGSAVCVLIAVGMEMALLGLLLALCAWLIQLELLPVEYMNGYCILCVFLSVFPVCATTSGARGRGYLPFCLLCGGGACVFLLVAAALLNGAEPYGAWTLRVFAAVFIAALAAAFVQIRHNAKRKNRRKKR